MTAPLAGRTIVVTRPRRQAGPFTAAATRAGARCIGLPAIEIERVPLGSAERAQYAPDAHDWAIYTSANAVEASFDQLPPPSRCRIAAVGRATARALESHGVVVHALPDGRADSEGLLELPVFASLAGRRIVILRGVGGRELLRDELRARGATVHVAEVYRRVPARADAGALAALEGALAAGARDVVVAVTSVDVLDGLIGLLPPALAEVLRDATVLLPGERVAEAARERGWRGPQIVAPTAEDAAMLAALAAQAAAPGDPAPA